MNKNQQKVYEWIKSYSDIDSGDNPLLTISYMFTLFSRNQLDPETSKALFKLTRKEEFEILKQLSEEGVTKVKEREHVRTRKSR